jgi:hypothetical protein
MAALSQRPPGLARGCTSESARELVPAITPSLPAAYVRAKGDAMRKALAGAAVVIIVALLILRFLSC